ncbi:MAG: hypothetical protein Q8S13_10210, partial [Dehalococcoidia bacterium]|nr:hypothetical protein [Dehalococcoidia bacterium]
RGVTQQVVDALRQLPRLYARYPAVREILGLDAAQESWMRLATHPRRRPLAVMGRLDATATFSHAAWRETFQLLEPNAVAVGGVHYAPTACSIILDVLGDVLARAYPGRRLVPTPDPRRLLLEELAGVSTRLGRRLRTVALLENADYTTGTDEFGSLARDLSQEGLTAFVADPRQFRVSPRGQLMVGDREVDLIYRDCELSEFVEMEEGGARLTAMRRAIQEGRLVSGLLWEFDHKSCWEILTDPTYARAFTPSQRRLFARHIPWTRLVRQTHTRDPRGARVDLVRYVRAHQASLVLKPNTLYGGQGVVVGRTVTRAVWERTLAQALRGDTPYVAQELARIATHRFPVLAHGRPREVERCVVSGFFFTSRGAGLVGRFSKDPVVNVSRGGGLLSALMVA